MITLRAGSYAADSHRVDANHDFGSHLPQLGRSVVGRGRAPAVHGVGRLYPRFRGLVSRFRQRRCGGDV